MNIIAAIESGKPFRRKDQGTAWLTADNQGLSWVNGGRSYTKEDIMADDYEIKEISVMITRSQFWEACATALKMEVSEPAGLSIWRYRGTPPPMQSLVLLAQLLGLESKE